MRASDTRSTSRARQQRLDRFDQPGRNPDRGPGRAGEEPLRNSRLAEQRRSVRGDPDPAARQLFREVGHHLALRAGQTGSAPPWVRLSPVAMHSGVPAPSRRVRLCLRGSSQGPPGAAPIRPRLGRYSFAFALLGVLVVGLQIGRIDPAQQYARRHHHVLRFFEAHVEGLQNARRP